MSAPETSGAGPAAGPHCRKCGAVMALTAPTPTGKFNRRTGAPETPRRLECPKVPRRFRVFLGDNGHDSWTWHDLEGESGYDWAPDYEILP